MSIKNSKGSELILCKKSQRLGLQKVGKQHERAHFKNTRSMYEWHGCPIRSIQLQEVVIGHPRYRMPITLCDIQARAEPIKIQYFVIDTISSSLHLVRWLKGKLWFSYATDLYLRHSHQHCLGYCSHIFIMRTYAVSNKDHHRHACKVVLHSTSQALRWFSGVMAVKMFYKNSIPGMYPWLCRK